MITINHNKHWSEPIKPEVTVITPFYNRSYCLNRVFESVCNQTYRDFEYIIIDDGSVEDNDYIVEEFMSNVEFPVMYIKKSNGGVHTARNIGIKYSRGKYIVCIDSDDELLPEALQMMTDVWSEISENCRDEYFEVKFRCSDKDGNNVGPAFSENINKLPYKKRISIYEKIHWEHIGVRRGDIMRANPWPEPDGITFVTENILWCQLRRKYKSYFTNQIARIYHTETLDSITQTNYRNKNTQSVKNSFWNVAYCLNHKGIYYDGCRIALYLRDIVRYCIFDHILIWKGSNHKRGLNGTINNLIVALMWIPCILPAYIYSKRRMKK